MIEFLAERWLDIVTTLLGLAYILLEYKASIWLWVVGFMMQSLDIVLYYQKGLYADCGMEFYYIAMTIYGFVMWQAGKQKKSTVEGSETNAKATQERPIEHFPKDKILPATLLTLMLWAITYYLLVRFTDSTVPIADSFTTAFSFVAIWALARKYLEQWLLWIAVDVVTFVLYLYKDIPFKAGLYGLYIIIAVMGFFKWKKMMHAKTI